MGPIGYLLLLLIACFGTPGPGNDQSPLFLTLGCACCRKLHFSIVLNELEIDATGPVVLQHSKLTEPRITLSMVGGLEAPLTDIVES